MGQLCILLTLVLAIASSTTISGKVLKPRLSGRIVGGSDAHEGQFPYQVSIRTSDNEHFCGGAIYSKHWIITAGHCLFEVPAKFTSVYTDTILVDAGTSYDVDKIVVHPEFDSFSEKNDIALLKTKKPIEFNENVKPIPLGSEYLTKGIAVISGWGNLKHNGELSTVLQYVLVDVIENGDCIERHANTGFAESIYNNTICTLSPKGKGTCENDSGGPLVMNGELIGVVNWGIPCAKGLPDAFARVASHKEWITKTAV